MEGRGRVRATQVFKRAPHPNTGSVKSPRAVMYHHSASKEPATPSLTESDLEMIKRRRCYQTRRHGDRVKSPPRTPTNRSRTKNVARLKWTRSSKQANKVSIVGETSRPYDVVLLQSDRFGVVRESDGKTIETLY